MAYRGRMRRRLRKGGLHEALCDARACGDRAAGATGSTREEIAAVVAIWRNSAGPRMRAPLAL